MRQSFVPRRKLPPRRRPDSFRSIATLTLIPIAGLLLFLVARFVIDHLPLPPVESPARKAPVTAAKALPKKALPVISKRGEIVLILDDVGYDRQPLDRAMQIETNLNFAVLPNAPRAAEFAGRLHRKGFEILCHLPMEPRDNAFSPGEKAVRTAMSDEEITRVTREGIAAIPHARGVNNHMGSLASSDRRVMEQVIGALPRGMYFIDSKTAGDSVGEEIARKLRVKTASRHVFLDDVQEVGAIRQQLRKLASIADQRGLAIGIGHMYPETIAVLQRDVPDLRARGYRFVRASEAVQ